MKNLVIFGAGGHAESLIDIVMNHSDWQVSSIIGKDVDLGKKIREFRVNLSEDNLNTEFLNETKYALIGIGQIGLDKRRYNLFKNRKIFPNFSEKIVSPLAYLSKDSEIGNGSVLFSNSLVNANVKIGDHCIVNSKALIEHGCKIGDFCHISTGAIINGGVKIGNGVLLVRRAIIREGLNLPDNTNY